MTPDDILKELYSWWGKYGYAASDQSRGFFEKQVDDAVKLAEKHGDSFREAVLMALIIQQAKFISKVRKEW